MNIRLNNEILGKTIYNLRTERNLRLIDVAEATGYTLQHISHIEHGIKNCNLLLAIKLANIFDITVDELCRDAISVS